MTPKAADYVRSRLLDQQPRRKPHLIRGSSCADGLSGVVYYEEEHTSRQFTRKTRTAQLLGGLQPQARFLVLGTWLGSVALRTGQRSRQDS